MANYSKLLPSTYKSCLKNDIHTHTHTQSHTDENNISRIVQTLQCVFGNAGNLSLF